MVASEDVPGDEKVAKETEGMRGWVAGVLSPGVEGREAVLLH
jgi:hypothetical protein